MNYTLLMELASRIGCGIAQGGAETYRVEESVNRVLTAYGVESKVYSVPNSLIISIIVPDQAPITRLCRMDRKGTDLDAVEQYSNLGRRICIQKPDLETAMLWLEEAEKKRKQYPLPLVLLGNILVAFGFTVFFGGNLMDAVWAALCGLLLGLSGHFMRKFQASIFFKNIASAFIVAFVAYGAGVAGLTPNPDAAIIGTLMLLVPGILFTNALRDLIFGDTNSGVNRVADALMIAVAVALGTVAAWNLCAVFLGVPPQISAIDHGPLITCLASFIACAGFVFVFNVHGIGAILCAFGGVIVWGSYSLALKLGCSPLWSCFIATCAAGVFSEVMARIRKYPAISYLVISVLPLIPGAGAYYTAQQALIGNMEQAADYALNTSAVAGVMAAGILVVSTTVRIYTTRKSR